jgi:predicted enzyme related to lactoylglutathione lyase
MKIMGMIPALDTNDLETESTFWANVLGGEVARGEGPDDDWHSVIVDGKQKLGVQYVENHEPPQWPDGPQRTQVHLDLYVEDLDAAEAEVIGFGATALGGPEQDGTEGFRVYADPAGHPFCLCRA